MLIDRFLIERCFQPVIDKTRIHPNDAARFCVMGAILGEAGLGILAYPSLMSFMSVSNGLFYVVGYLLIETWCRNIGMRVGWLCFVFVFTPSNIVGMIRGDVVIGLTQCVNLLILAGIYLGACRTPPPRHRREPVGKLAPVRP